MYFRRKTSAGRAYLQIVESRCDGDQVRQQVIATLGRFDELQASGQLERLVHSGARFAAKAMVLSAASNDAAIKIAVRRIGPALVFERLWEETGCRAVITALAGQRKHGFALERAVFLTVLHRLFIAALDRVSSWPEIIADLDSLTETEIEYDGKHFIVRSAPRPAATLALRAAGVALPPTIRYAAVS
jgi:hypothetical protein